MRSENTIIWENCYDEGWQDIIVPEAFSHPAKMSYGLLKRILAHAKEQGWLKQGDIILDPFGGIGSTGILGAYEGYQVVCVELEQKFVDLAKENFDLHEHCLEIFGLPFPIMIQGDSRRLCEIVQKEILSCKKEQVDAIISSPPYADAVNAESKMEVTGELSLKRGGTAGGKFAKGLYKGQTSGNLGNLKSGDVDLVLSSPPYEGSDPSFSHGQGKSRTDPNSPNYRPIAKRDWDERESARDYGHSEGQLGQGQGDTFWQAAKIIIEQCYQILKPGGHAIWVCKDFVRKGKRVPFSKDWSRLCESVGFELVHWHKATLVKEIQHETLWGEIVTTLKEYKSFFRRLTESKGSPKIDEEDVICMEKK